MAKQNWTDENASSEDKVRDLRDQQATRREFLKGLGTAGATAALNLWSFSCRRGPTLEAVENPLSYYPNRDWERIYRDQYQCDRSFTWVCAPNDTHMCRLRAFVRNGVIVRSEQNYDHDRYKDLYGNQASPAWNPRGCLKGYTFHRRVYGPYRLKGPAIRKGWKQWADDGFPSLSDHPELRTKYRFDDRGNDTFVRVSWDEATHYAANGLMAIARTYSGDAGRERFKKDGYPQEMLEHWKGAGTRTMKIGSSLPVHGVIGKFGLFRFANMMALLDHHVRNLPPEQSLGAREWSEYTWRGDQAPGQPFVHGLQTADCDFNDLRHTRLHIQVGKNLIENKMPESHWLTEVIERGGKIVNIAPEYNCPATKADYFIPVRPGLSDTAIFLYLSKYLMDEKLYDAEFVRRFTDLPLLVRTDTLTRLKPEDVFPDYQMPNLAEGPSYRIQGLTDEQRQRVGDFVIHDQKSDSLKALTRDDVGDRLRAKGIEPSIEWTATITTTSGKKVEVMTTFALYRLHLKDYDLDTVSEITSADKDLILRLAHDIATIKPVAVHHGEGINHYFHATLHNRAVHLPLMLTANIGQHGAGVFTWAGNYKGAVFQGSNWSGSGAGVYKAEDPFNPVLDPQAKIGHENIRHTTWGEEVGYWGAGDRPLIVDTPQGRKIFTGKTHMPSPTKLFWYNNANLINQAKWVYHLVRNVNPKVDMIVDQQIEWTGSAEYADLVLPANAWVESQTLEAGSSCSNPFLSIWGGTQYEATHAIAPLYDSLDDGMIFAKVAEKLAQLTGDQRFRDYWRFMLSGQTDVYLDRVFASCTTTRTQDGKRYTVKEVMNGAYGNEPGTVLMLYRTYPRVPFYEQVHDSIPFYTDTGRLNSYCDIPEAIEYGENFIVHREGPEATPYLPNAIVSSNPYIRPSDYGIPLSAMDADLRQVRNVKLPWSRVKQTKNPLWEQGFRLFCTTPKSRHTVHSSWSVVDWNWLWADNFGDPFRKDKRAPGVGDREIMINPDMAKCLGIQDGDYVYVDANPTDRPFVGWQKDPARYKAFRCMVRVKFNPGLPLHFTIMKHTGWIATERTVKAHETRPDGRAFSEETGYQASYRYGSHQSITRAWMMPMHQTDHLFHKKIGGMGFLFGFDDDNHAINSVPKETLIRITKAEDGGLQGQGVWGPAATGLTPGNESPRCQQYLLGGFVKVRKS
ncbi:MAG: molybdopterin-dependent oxidoreductase [Acidobacteriota bacterium]